MRWSGIFWHKFQTKNNNNNKNHSKKKHSASSFPYIRTQNEKHRVEKYAPIYKNKIWLKKRRVWIIRVHVSGLLVGDIFTVLSLISWNSLWQFVVLKSYSVGFVSSSPLKLFWLFYYWIALPPSAKNLRVHFCFCLISFGFVHLMREIASNGHDNSCVELKQAITTARPQHIWLKICLLFHFDMAFLFAVC